ncbi:unnamed protein product [Clonostachys chloroleuca]|uniref:Aquaporin-like protein n=1 Tax=Clonostachys chloroleuca TaxID=1926264 RepID=A0AA35Q1I3_9HYPO|nr:unnamed protein product [Clonostachys chloroleuca]
MAGNPRHRVPQINGPDPEGLAASTGSGMERGPNFEINIPPFIGRLGGNGVALSREPSNEAFLEKVPDAAPLMSLRDIFNPKPFLTVSLWKSALMEGVGSLMLVWLTIYANVSPATIPAMPTQRWGNFDNASFIGPLVGGILNFFYITMFTFCFGAVSGAHLNPTITIATLFARLCSLPRAVLYVSFQVGGAALGGLLARASYGTRDFKVGGCWLYTDIVPVWDAFTIELMACTILLFFAFGVGLDPRQRNIIGPTLGTFLVGIALGSLSFGTGFTRYGYGGASMNPARCFGSYVGSSFPGFHWIHWAADFIACIVHAVFYHVCPPWAVQQSR